MTVGIAKKIKFFMPKQEIGNIVFMLDQKQVKMVFMAQACLQELSIQNLKH